MSFIGSLPTVLQWFVFIGFFILVTIIIFSISKLLKSNNIQTNWKEGKISVKAKGSFPDGVIAFSPGKLDSLLELLIDSVRDVAELSLSKLMATKMEYVVERLSTIESAFIKESHKLLQEKGVLKTQVSLHIDFVYVQEVLRNIIYTDNGVKSMKSIIRHQIKHKVYEDSATKQYLEPLLSTLYNNASQYLMTHFHNTVVSNQKNQMDRLLSREDMFEILDSIKSVVRDELEIIFTYAIKCDQDFKKSEDKLLEDRKYRIKKLIMEVPNE